MSGRPAAISATSIDERKCGHKRWIASQYPRRKPSFPFYFILSLISYGEKAIICVGDMQPVRFFDNLPTLPSTHLHDKARNRFIQELSHQAIFDFDAYMGVVKIAHRMSKVFTNVHDCAVLYILYTLINSAPWPHSLSWTDHIMY